MAKFPDIQVFTAGISNWTKPNKAKIVEVFLIGGGGGGQSGDRFGAGGFGKNWGGRGGCWHKVVFNASDLGAVESVIVGAGGAGGTSVTTDDTVGTDGVDGNSTTFGTNFQFTAPGGKGGTTGGAAPADYHGTYLGGTSAYLSPGTPGDIFAAAGGGSSGQSFAIILQPE